jgi:hypothetical protein
VELVRINLLPAASRILSPPNPKENIGMTKRKALSKRDRFEILKRDGFKCVYCGATPRDSALAPLELVVDHVQPVKEGGETVPHNLVTACIPCNAGKSAIPLEQRKYDPRLSEAQKEQAEQLVAYLDLQREIADANEQWLNDIEEDWDRLTGLRRPYQLRGNLRNLLREYTLDQLREGMEKLGAARLNGPPLPYFRGILKNLGKPFTPKPPPAPAPRPESQLVQATKALIGLVVGEMNETKEPKTFAERCARVRAAFAYAAGADAAMVDYFADPGYQTYNEDEELNGLCLRVDAWADDSFQVRVWDVEGYDVYRAAYQQLSDEIYNSLSHFFSYYGQIADPDEKKRVFERYLEGDARTVSDKDYELRRLVAHYTAFGLGRKRDE